MAENTQAGQRLSEALTGDMIADVMSGTRRIDLTDLEAAVEVLSDIDIPASSAASCASTTLKCSMYSMSSW